MVANVATVLRQVVKRRRDGQSRKADRPEVKEEVHACKVQILTLPGHRKEGITSTHVRQVVFFVACNRTHIFFLFKHLLVVLPIKNVYCNRRNFRTRKNFVL